jgi:hypothetical protein
MRILLSLCLNHVHTERVRARTRNYGTPVDSWLLSYAKVEVIEVTNTLAY